MSRIVLFGATGYTGELAARALVDRGEKPVLAARSRDKLERLAGELDGGLEIAEADVSRPASVRALVERGDVLVSTVGPFARWGGPAVQAAVASGAHYIDSTGEPEFIREVFERHGPGAEAAGCALVSAIEGFEVDFHWPDQRLIVELDGRAAHHTRTAFERDRARDRTLQAAGWRVVRITWHQLQAEPAQIAADLGHLLSMPGPHETPHIAVVEA